MYSVGLRRSEAAGPATVVLADGVFEVGLVVTRPSYLEAARMTASNAGFG